MRGIEFTLREFIVSGFLIIFMLAIGVYISVSVHDHYSEKSEAYLRALKVTDKELFNYALTTNVGNVLAEGTFEAVHPIKHKNLTGEFLYIKEVEEHYVQKTRQVSYKCGERTCYRTETYWEWEAVDSHIEHVKQFKFLDRTFNYEQVAFNNVSYERTHSVHMTKRYKYYTINRQFDGTLFAKTIDNDISNTKLHVEQSIKSVMEQKTKAADHAVTVFWVIWVLVMAASAFGFMALENRYLNDKTN